MGTVRQRLARLEKRRAPGPQPEAVIAYGFPEAPDVLLDRWPWAEGCQRLSPSATEGKLLWLITFVDDWRGDGTVSGASIPDLSTRRERDRARPFGRATQGVPDCLPFGVTE